MISFWQDYSNIFTPKHYNWVSFTFIHFYMEYDAYGPEFDVELGLLGLNLRMQIGLPWKTKQSKRLEKLVKEVKWLPKEKSAK